VEILIGSREKESRRGEQEVEKENKIEKRKKGEVQNDRETKPPPTLHELQEGDQQMRFQPKQTDMAKEKRLACNQLNFRTFDHCLVC
jgi:hypothetical protein